jgi:hypothetical protein
MTEATHVPARDPSDGHRRRTECGDRRRGRPSRARRLRRPRRPRCLRRPRRPRRLRWGCRARGLQRGSCSRGLRRGRGARDEGDDGEREATQIRHGDRPAHRSAPLAGSDPRAARGASVGAGSWRPAARVSAPGDSAGMGSLREENAANAVVRASSILLVTGSGRSVYDSLDRDGNKLAPSERRPLAVGACRRGVAHRAAARRGWRRWHR